VTGTLGDGRSESGLGATPYSIQLVD